MFGNLSHHTDDELLNIALMILASPDSTGHVASEIDAFHQTELSQIEAEFMRRGTLCGEEYNS